MNRLETVSDANWREFTAAPRSVLVLAESECPHCRAWTLELSEFLAADQDWREVRFGKLNLDAADVEDFKQSNEWLEFVEGLPFNILYVEGQPRNSFSGGGIKRLLKRLNRLSEKPD